MKFALLFLLKFQSLLAAAAHTSSQPAIKVVYQFPNNTWVENLAVRSNGNILATLITSPEVWHIHPFNHSAELIASFPEATSTLGIAEFEPDKFAVVVGNWSDVTGRATPKSWSVWSIDFCDHHNASARHRQSQVPRMHKVADIPEAGFLNGMTSLPTQPHTILVGDAYGGVIWRVDMKTGAYSVAIENPDLSANNTAIRELGVNGIHYLHGSVYFVNTFKRPLYSRIPIHANGTSSGPVEVILDAAPFPLNAVNAQADDFALDAEGNAWITNPSDTLFKVTPDGKASIIAGSENSTALIGCTSAAFGRTVRTQTKLYITSDGGLAVPPPGGVRPGKIWAIDTAGL